MSVFPTVRVLFTGYAHVHFICFQSLYERLKTMRGVEVYVSGGLRTSRQESGRRIRRHDAAAMYAPFDIPPDRVLTLAEIAKLDFDLVFAGNTKVMKPRSSGTTVQIFHGVSFRNKAVRSEQLVSDVFFLVGPYMQRKFAQAGLLAADDPRAVPIGFPKTDRLIDGTLSKQATARSLGLSGRRKLVLYAPTGQRDNSLETMGEEVIRRIAARGDCDLVIKPHDHAKDQSTNWFERLAPLESEHVRVTRQLDVIPLLHAADVLITDASSVASEFSLVGRPVLYLDVPGLVARASKAAESQVDLQTWGRRGGLVAHTPGDVPDALAFLLDNPAWRAEVRAAQARDLFFNPGHATAAASDWVDAHISKIRRQTVARGAA